MNNEDKRYTVGPENTGRACLQYVARFCGSWIGCHDTPAGAWGLCEQHDRHRMQPYAAAPAVDPKAQQLDEFTRGYVTALLWSSTDTDPATGDDVNLDECELSTAGADKCRADCRAFFTANYADLTLYAEQRQTDAAQGTTWDYAGHDYALTRNGHGAGFWDRPELDDALGARLSEASTGTGPATAYIGDDGTVYL